MSFIPNNNNKDAFGLLEVAQPQVDFDAQLTYGDQSLLYEKVQNSGSITYDSTDGVLLISNNSLPGMSYVQTYRYFPYRPGIGKKVFITFNFGSAVEGSMKYAQFGDSNNAIGIRLLGNGVLEGYITTSTTEGNQSRVIDTQSNSIDISKEQILVIQFEALYVGSVQIGLQLEKRVVWLVEFDNANISTRPYIRTANLPIRLGITTTGTNLSTMIFNCCSVQNMGGSQEVTGFDFQANSSLIALNGVATHALSLRPKALFKSFVNRVDYINFEISISVTGSRPVRWQLVVGQALVGPTYLDVNSDYSSMEYSTGVTLSGLPSIVIDGGTILATTQFKGILTKGLTFKYPITLDAAGLNRDLGTITLLIQGIGGTSECDCYINWREVR